MLLFSLVLISILSSAAFSPVPSDSTVSSGISISLTPSLASANDHVPPTPIHYASFSPNSTVEGGPSSTVEGGPSSTSVLPPISSVFAPRLSMALKPMYSRESGFQGKHYRCASFEALLLCLYSLPPVQSAFYREANELLSKTDLQGGIFLSKSNFIVATALLFSRLRSRDGPLTNPPHFLDPLRLLLGSQIDFCRLSPSVLWIEIYHKLPRSLVDIFTVAVDVALHHSDTVAPFHLFQVRFRRLTISMNMEYPSITNFIQMGQFITPDDLKYMKALPESEMQNLSVFSSISNAPEVFTVDLHRFNPDPETKKSTFNTREILVDTDLKLKNSEYTLMGCIEYIPELGSYRTTVHDPFVKGYYQVENGAYTYPSNINFASMNTRAIMLLYVPLSSISVLNLSTLFYGTFLDIPAKVSELSSYLITPLNKTKAEDTLNLSQSSKRARQEARVVDLKTDGGVAAPSTVTRIDPSSDLSSGIIASSSSKIDISGSSQNASHVESSPAEFAAEYMAIYNSGTSQIHTPASPHNSPIIPSSKITTGILPETDHMLKWNHIYRPVYSDYPAESMEKFMAAEAFINSKIDSWPVQMLDVLAKVQFGTYVLGSGNFSFDSQSMALELILVSLAFNRNVFFNLLKKVKELSTLLKLILFKSIQILFGCKNIKLNMFQKCLPENLCGRYTDIQNLSLQMNGLINAINDDGLIKTPTMKVVQFPNMTTDDPSEFSFRSAHPVIPSSLIPMREARIRGIWCDNIEKQNRFCRMRYIYSSSSEIVPIQVSRFNDNKPFNMTSITFGGSDYISIGYVGFDPKSIEVSVNVFNHFTGEFLSYKPGQESRQIEKASPEGASILKKMNSNSILLLFTKKTSMESSAHISILSNSIPTNLILSVFHCIGTENGLKKSKKANGQANEE